MGANILKTAGFTNCEESPSIVVNVANVEYNADAETITYEVSGTSTEEQKVMASLNVTAYGILVYSKNFDPCDNGTYVDSLCPGKSVEFSYWESLANNTKSRLALFRPQDPRPSRQHTPARFHL